MATLQKDRPDLIVGIDFGTLYTAVAWTDTVIATQTLSKWPGCEDHKAKVPTKLVYGPNNEVVKWGFLCGDDDEEDGFEVRESFKIYLNQNNTDRAPELGVADGSRVEEARRFTTDYLRLLYGHIKRSIEANTGPWEKKKVEFFFGIPGTWTSMDVIATFHNIIREAGFGMENPSIHTVKLVNDIQATATYVAANPAVKLENGDIILICDIGGTIDLGLLDVIDAISQPPEFTEAAAVQSIWFEPTIDRAFQNAVQKRLDENPDASSNLPNNLALKIAQSNNFQAIKHAFGRAEFDQPEYKIALDRLDIGVSRDFSCPELGIERGRMTFSRDEIQLLFDPLVEEIAQRIDEQLAMLQLKRSNRSVKYIVLSSALICSPYLDRRLKQIYSQASKNVSILRSPEPKLSLVKGLVVVGMQMQRLVCGAAPTVTARTLRASYGVVCRQRYNPKIHAETDIEPDTERRPKWAKEQIEWLLKTGDDVDTHSPVEKSITRKIDPSYLGPKLDTLIMVSYNSRKTLPKSLKDNGAQKLCSWDFDLDEIEASNSRPRSRHFWQRKPEFYETNFTVKAIPGPAQLDFELWCKERMCGSLTLQMDHWVERGQAGVSGRRYASDDNWERYTGGRSGRS